MVVSCSFCSVILSYASYKAIFSMFFVSMVLIVLGTGLLQTRMFQHCRGNLHGKSDERRDSGFSIFYMGINMGASLLTIYLS